MWRVGPLFAALALGTGFAGLSAIAQPVGGGTVRNPDQITVFFPIFEGEGNLGRNVATVLSLQLAQTTRRAPWPDNPMSHDFGEGIIRWSESPLEQTSHSSATEAAQAIDLLAQMVVWGRTHRYAGDVIAEIQITLPGYAPPSQRACGPDAPLVCDYREKNFERWVVRSGGTELSVDLPRRRFGLTAVRLREDVVEGFSVAVGLPIRESLSGGRILGVTGTEMRFIEFNRTLPGAPTKLRSNGVTGYVTLPELSNRVSEYADMAGGILQVFRGDWDAAVGSFGEVIKNPTTRTPLLVDALLYRGMAEFHRGGNDLGDFREAMRSAPLDRRAVQYLVMGLVSAGGSEAKAEASKILGEATYLFSQNDPWLASARAVIGRM